MQIELSEETYNKVKDQILAEEAKLKEKKIEIKSRSGDVIYTSSKTTIKEAVEEAVASEANLSGANLRRANLHEANLRGADLSGADLRGAEMQNIRLFGRGGVTKISKSQADDFFKAIGVIVK